MKKWWMCLALAFTTAISALAQQATDILGTWLNEEGDAKIEVYQEGEVFFGKLIWIKDYETLPKERQLDSKNPDPKLRTRSKLGMILMKDLVFDDDEWTDGEIYDARSGKLYSLTATLDGNNKLDLRGYVGVSLFGRTSSWTRAQ